MIITLRRSLIVVAHFRRGYVQPTSPGSLAEGIGQNSRKGTLAHFPVSPVKAAGHRDGKGDAARQQISLSLQAISLAPPDPPFIIHERSRTIQRGASLFLKEVAQKETTSLPRQDLPHCPNRFRPNFRGWDLDEFSIIARPPPGGITQRGAHRLMPRLCERRRSPARLRPYRRTPAWCRLHA